MNPSSAPARAVDDLMAFAPDRERALILFFTREAVLADTLTIEGRPASVDMPIDLVLDRGRDVGAAHVMLCHTHPSGDPRPSHGDIVATRILCAGLRNRGMRLLDHIVIARGASFSFRSNGLL